MKVKTSTLTGRQLDYAVAVAQGATDFQSNGICWSFMLGKRLHVLAGGWNSMSWIPSVDHGSAGPILAAAFICRVLDHSGVWLAYVTDLNNEKRFMHSGSTDLIAGLRCFIAMTLGDVVEIPDHMRL